MNSNALMLNCKAYHCDAGGLKVWRREGDNFAEKTVTVINGIFSDCGYDHDSKSADTNPGVKVSMGAGLNMYNCIITDCYDQGLNIRVKLTGSGADQNGTYLPVKVFNTIITGIKAGAAIRDGGYLEDSNMHILEANYNLYYNNKMDASGFNIGKNSITTKEPQFDSGSPDGMQLSENSPAIDSGMDLSNIDPLYKMYGRTDRNGME